MDINNKTKRKLHKMVGLCKIFVCLFLGCILSRFFGKATFMQPEVTQGSMMARRAINIPWDGLWSPKDPRIDSVRPKFVFF